MLPNLFKRLSLKSTKSICALRENYRSNYSRRLHYAYPTLASGEIRLLEPTYETGKLTWSLRTVNFIEDTGFDCLSYMWNPNPTQTEMYHIICNGKEMKVQENLYRALPYLADRHKDTESRYRPIWIDAICINQQDEKEKEVQIKMMHLIYSLAKTTWVWFGTSQVHERIPEAIELLPKIIEAGKHIQVDFESSETEDEKTFREKNNIHEPHRYNYLDDSHGLNNLDPELWTAVKFLVDNSWYRRVWVVQEAALAHELVYLCGAHQIPFDLLDRVSQTPIFRLYLRDANGDRANLDVSHCRWIGWSRQLFRKGISSREFSRIAASMALNSECHLPQDRISGVLGLLHDPADPDLVSRYQEGIGTIHDNDIEGMYINFTIAILDSTDGFEWWSWLSLAFSYNRMEDLPTWVPDLHHLGADYGCFPWKSIIGIRHKGGCPYKASGRAKKTNLDPPGLRMEGLLFDKVSVVHPGSPAKLSETSSHAACTRWVIDMVKWEQSLAATFMGGQSADDGYSLDGREDQREYPRVSFAVYWETVMFGLLEWHGDTYTVEHYLRYRTVMYRYVELIEKYGFYECLLTHQPEPTLPPDDAEELARLNQLVAEDPVITLLNVFFSNLDLRDIFITERGRMGITLQGVEPGDIVCVFSGAWTPHVIRKFELEGVEYHNFIGDAYVSGLMSGEADELDGARQDFLMV